MGEAGRLDELVFSAHMHDGSPLPAWLAPFDSSDATNFKFDGDATGVTQADVGTYHVIIEARDKISKGDGSFNNWDFVAGGFTIRVDHEPTIQNNMI